MDEISESWMTLMTNQNQVLQSHVINEHDKDNSAAPLKTLQVGYGQKNMHREKKELLSPV